MVGTTGTTDRLVRVVNGRWARTSNLGWGFIANPQEAVKKLSIYESEGYNGNKQILMDRFGLSKSDGDLYLTFQWPERMDIDCLETIVNNKTMEIYLGHVEIDELPLMYISKVSVENSVDANALQVLEENGKSALNEDDECEFKFWQQCVQEDVAFGNWVTALVAGTSLTHEESEPSDENKLAVAGANRASVESFGMLPSYINWLQKSPGYVNIQLKLDNEHKFKYVFLAFSASLKGFAFMRRVIVLDKAYLHGRYGGCLLIACCQDGNFQAYPLAFAIVDNADDDACERFFRILKTAIPDSDGLTFISEWHSSISNGARKSVYNPHVYTKASHGACVVHLQRDICKSFQDPQLANLVSKAARIYRVDDFHAAFAEIGRIEPECATYLEELGFNHWTRSHFMGNRYNIMTSNMVESFNAVFKEAREYPIISLLECIKTTMMKLFATMREVVKAHKAAYPPKLQEWMKKNFQISKGFTAQRVGEYEYKVSGDTKRLFCVNLRRKKCTCLEFNLLMLPCPHALCAAVAEGMDIHELVGSENPMG